MSLSSLNVTNLTQLLNGNDVNGIRVLLFNFDRIEAHVVHSKIIEIFADVIV